MAIYSRSSLQNFDNWWIWIRKTNTLLNLIKEQDNDDLIDKIHLYAKDLSEAKYEYVIRNCENAGIKHLNDSKAFIECSNTMNDVYEKIDNYISKRKRKILIVFDDMIADIMTNKINNQRTIY